MAIRKQNAELTIEATRVDSLQVCVLGKTPLICNRLSQKAQRELLLPKGRKTAADKASSLKHDPVEEFRAAPYTLSDPEAPTLIAHLATAFKNALRSAAVDMSGANKAQMGRLTYVEGPMIPIYGVPKLFMAITRSADQNKTPDVRTRAILPEWAAELTVCYTHPVIKETAIVNLLAAAGLIQGVGDWRPEKGSGNYGQFELVSPDDPRYRRVVAEGGRQAQVEAMEAAEPYDAESEELLSWFDVEVKRRGFKVA